MLCAQIGIGNFVASSIFFSRMPLGSTSRVHVAAMRATEGARSRQDGNEPGSQGISSCLASFHQPPHGQKITLEGRGIIHSAIRACVRVYMVCVHSCVQACGYACMYACVRAYMVCVPSCLHACKRMSMHACMRACVRACMRTCAMRAHVCLDERGHGEGLGYSHGNGVRSPKEAPEYALWKTRV